MHHPAVAQELASGSQLLTIGYQGRSVSDLVRRLRAHDVRVLVDVRERALSRRPDFNGVRLSAALERAGIVYRHIPELGSKSSLRQTLWETKDFERFAGLYLAYLRRWRLGDVNVLARLVHREGVVCILCYELDADSCHRRILAEEAQRQGRRFEVLHL